jgi:hypothetical protein
MTIALKRLSIATATAGLLVALMTGALAQAPADPHHPQGAPSSPSPGPLALLPLPQSLSVKGARKVRMTVRI